MLKIYRLLSSLKEIKEMQIKLLILWSHNTPVTDPSVLALTLWAYSARCLTGLLLFDGYLTSQQHASVSQGRICSDKFTCYHTKIEAAGQVFHLAQSQYTDTGPASPSADSITPGAWQASHWSANFEVTGMTWSRKNPGASWIQTRDLPLSRRTP